MNLRDWLFVGQLAYDPRIVWDLPEGAPPYEKTEKGMSLQGTLHQSIPKTYVYLKGGSPNISKFKRENLFIKFLESLDPDDQDLILACKEPGKFQVVLKK